MVPRRDILSGVETTSVQVARQGSPLTERELQVIKLICEELTTREIAALLKIGVKTAESHRTRLMQKLDIHTTAGLVRYAIRQGLVVA